ncbi:MAG TPA: nitrate reductase molybdenum cofactor assembly chaperone [Thiohalobacter sp.]|nr:nitrate reductase molybdenum cofactor assembly chaperone [Thiohalobacter sp.]
MRTLKVIATLLHYPDTALQQHGGPLQETLMKESLLTGAELSAFAAFIEALCEQDLIEVQSRYVETFDRGRARSLYLFEHVHGESRDRGQAMVELSRIYRQHGYVIDTAELPDYLPLYLEFLSTLAPAAALERLAEIGELLQHLHGHLSARHSPYAIVLEPLLRLSGVEADAVGLRERIAAEPPDDTPAALDAVWMESPVTFGGPAPHGCGGDHPPRVQRVEWADRRTPPDAVVPGGGNDG